LAKACVDAFLTTDFDPGDDGRHQRRVGRIAEIARQSCK
jgi:ribose 5-phosphate isomerase RpiB